VDERLSSMDQQLDNIAEGVNRLNDRLERLLEDRP
jgi:ubiquinone biosynthesis protein UbiJ